MPLPAGRPRGLRLVFPQPRRPYLADRTWTSTLVNPFVVRARPRFASFLPLEVLSVQGSTQLSTCAYQADRAVRTHTNARASTSRAPRQHRRRSKRRDKTVGKRPVRGVVSLEPNASLRAVLWRPVLVASARLRTRGEPSSSRKEQSAPAPSSTTNITPRRLPQHGSAVRRRLMAPMARPRARRHRRPASRRTVPLTSATKYLGSSPAVPHGVSLESWAKGGSRPGNASTSVCCEEHSRGLGPGPAGRGQSLAADVSLLGC